MNLCSRVSGSGPSSPAPHRSTISDLNSGVYDPRSRCLLRSMASMMSILSSATRFGGCSVKPRRLQCIKLQCIIGVVPVW